MSVIKLSEKDIIRKGSDKIKLRKEDISYDTTPILGIEKDYRESSNLINDYINRRKKQEWMSEDELGNYRSALERYKSSTGSLRGLSDYDEEDEKKWNEYVSSLSTDLDSASEVYGRYKSADSFNAYMQAVKEREELSGLDLDSLWGEIADLEERIKRKDEPTDYSVFKPSTSGNSSPFGDVNPLSDPFAKYRPEGMETESAPVTNPTPGTYATKEELEVELSEKKAKYNRAKEIQERNKVLGMLEGVTDPTSANYDKDYDAYVQNGASIENPSYYDSQPVVDIFGWKPFGDGKEVNNPVTFSQKNSGKLFEGAGTNVRYDTSNIDSIVLYMTDEQINNYNYLISKHGRETADVYLEAVRDQIKGEKSDEFFEKNLEDKALAEMMYSLAQGLFQYSSGMDAVSGKNTADQVFVDPQMVGARAREDLYDDSVPVWYNFKEGKWEDKVLGSSVGQTVYDFGTTMANMAPSMAIGALSNIILPGAGAYVGAGLMGVSAGGNAYKEALNRGYDEGQAQTYGILVGGSEALLQYALGGISQMGGKLSNNVIQKMVSGIDNGFARFALDLGGRLTAEGLEEGLQEVLTPFFENLAFNAGNDWGDINWEQAAYSYLLGSLSALGMEGVGTARGHINYNSAIKAEGKEIVNAGATDSLVALANEMAGVSGGDVSKNLSARVNKVNGKKGVNVKAVGKLSEAVNNARIQQNKADIVKALEGKGVDSDKAAKYADILFQMNEEFFAGRKSTLELGTNAQWKKITGDENAYSVLRNIITNADSPVNVRNLRYNIARAGNKNTDNYSNTEGVKAVKNINPAVSEDGKTKVVSTDTEVTLKGVDHIETKQVDGKVEHVGYIKVVDSQGSESVVSDRDVEYGNRKEGILYESFIAMDVDPAYFDTYVSGFDANDFKTADGKIADDAVTQYALGFQNAYRYGWVGIESELGKSAFASKLNPSARKAAYDAGASAAKYSTESKQATLDTAVAERKESGQGKVKASGELHMDGVKTKKPTALQNAGIGIAKRLTALGVDVYIFESHQDAKGNWVDDRGNPADNGFYRASDGSIHIDLNAGENGQGIMVYTLAHELTHWMRDKAPREFKILADLLIKWYGEKGVSVSDLVTQRMVAEGVDWDTAYEEVIARSCESFLTDSNIAERIIELQHTDKKTWEIVRDKVLKFLDWLKSLYKNISVESTEGQLVREMNKNIDELYDAFYNALASASETTQWIGSRDISAFAEAKTTGGEVLFQHRAMEADKALYRDMLLKHGQMSVVEIDSLFNTIDQALDIIKSNLDALDYAWDVDIDDRAFSPVKKNSDSLYQVSLDFSTLCRKRILQQLVQARLQEALNKQLSREESIAIRDELMKIQEEGRQIEIACALCYVESARMKSPAQIKRFLANREAVILDFLAGKDKGDTKNRIKQAEADARAKLDKEHPDGVNGKNGNTYRFTDSAFSLSNMPKAYADQIRAAKKEAKSAYQPTAEEQRLIDVANSMSVSDFASATGLENLAKNYPLLFDVYTSFIVNATHAKGIENDTWWRAGDSSSIGDTLIANMNRENGLRSQSWSDFQVIHLLDYIAATIELSTRNTKEQAYSKVPDYIELMGNTGVMLNMSLIPTRAFSGKLEYDSVEGMDYKRSLALRDKYHATAGTICIGMDNGQIKLLLADGTIDYVIPYHKSGMAAQIRKLMHIPEWSNYEEYQSEKNLSRKDAEANAKKYGVKLLDESDPNYHKHTSFSDWFDLKEAQQIAKMENASPSNKSTQKKYGVMYGGYMAMQNAANNYLKLCAERGVSPVFSHEKANFTAEENYWKLLIDRKMVDNVTGEIIEQQTIKPIFDEGEVLRILNDELERYPKVKADQEYAIRTVMERFLSGSMNDRLDADTIASIMQKPVDNVAVTNILSSSNQYDAILSKETAGKVENDAKKSSRRGYSYNALISKPDMAITTVGGKVPTNRADVVAEAKRNAAKLGKANKDGSVSVHVNDVDADVVLGTNGLKHSLDRRFSVNAPVTLQAGSILQNSIMINELTPQKKEVDSSYVLIGAAIDGNGELYVVRSVVNKFSNELASMDVLYAINAKKGNWLRSMRPGFQGPVTSSTISIADLLDYVNQYFPDILPEDVLKHYGHTARPDGDLGESVLFSRRNSNGRELTEAQLEYFKDSHVRDADGNLLVVYHGTENGGYTIFNPKRSDDRISLFFTDNPNVAYTYSGSDATVGTQKAKSNSAWTEWSRQRGKGKAGMYPVYLNITNPLVVDAQGSSWGNILFNGEEKETREIARYAKKNGYDGVILKNLYDLGGHYNPEVNGEALASTVYVAFDSNQVKSVDNPNPTTDKDIHYSRREGVSNRSLLANALESATQHETEAKRLAEYKAKIDLVNAEEEKLRETRAKIAELSFAPGPKDVEAIKALNAEATRTANRISTYDKQLLNLEATAPLKALLEREKAKVRKREKQRAKEAVATYRERASNELKAVMQHNRESRERGIEGRKKTEMRHKIKSVVSELNQLLLHGTKDKHIKIDLQKATAEALSAINMDTINAEKRLEEIQRKIDATNDPDKIAELQKTYDHIEQQGENMMNKLTALKNAYEEIKDSSDPLVANAYHPEIEERIKNLRKKVGNTPLREMSLEQLEDVYDTYKMVLHTIRTANKKFKEDKGESIAISANRVMEEVHAVGGTKAKTLVLAKMFKKFFWNGLKPVYALRAIGSSTLSNMFNSIRAGEDTWAVDVSEAKRYFREVSEKHNYDSWDFDKQYKFRSKTGREFSLSIEQIMSLYAYSKRKQADEHLDVGGFVFDEAIEVAEKSKLGVPLKYEVNVATSHKLSREILGEIVSTLSEEQKAFADEMQAYLSDVMGAKGNEVSLEMFGVKLFKEKFYFPLKSAKQFMYEQNEVAGEVRLKNSGFSKETVAHAKNPIILSNFMDVWANHVNDMSMYHAFVLPLEDFNRVFNYKTPSTDNMDTESVKMYIQNAYGVYPIQYIKQLLTDLNGGARIDPTADIVTKGIGLFKKNAVFASASVVIQQPSAIARASAMIDTKYFATKLSVTQHKAEWVEVKKYAPVAIIKEMGYFDTHMGRSTTDFIKAKEYGGLAEKMKGLVTDSGYRDEVLSKAPALADELSWCYIWNVVKKEVADTTDLEVGSEEFLRKCGERFTEVVVNTQVYDSVLSRSAMMRSKDTGMKMATAFMAEPTTSINMIADAIIQGKRGNKKNASKQIGAVVASMILNSILVSFVYAGRDDDDDKTYAEKYAGTLVSELIDSINPLTMIPFVKDIVSIFNGYDVERSDMAVISDLFTAYKKLSNDNLSAYRKVEDFGGAIAAIFGLPVKNIMRDVRAMYNTVSSFIDGQQTTGSGVWQSVKGAVTGKDGSNTDQLYEAVISGDEAHEERVRDRFKDDRAVESALRKALRENDPRIREALKIRVNEGITDKYNRIRQEIINEGNFEQSIVNEAMKAEYDYFIGKIKEAADLLKDGDKEASNDIIRDLKKKYKGTFTQDDILKAVKKRAGLLK